jgi:hypothetical protein
MKDQYRIVKIPHYTYDYIYKPQYKIWGLFWWNIFEFPVEKYEYALNHIKFHKAYKERKRNGNKIFEID